MKKYQARELADRVKQAQAKKLSLHKVISPQEYAVLVGEPLDDIEPYLDYSYPDKELDNWFNMLRGILNNRSVHQDLIMKAELEENYDDADEWYVDIDRLKKVFLPWKLPQEIEVIAEYQNRRKDYLCSAFSIASDAEEIAEHLVGDRAPKLKIFAETRDGSCFGYWVSGSISNSPIVYLDSDIVGSQVVADTIIEFIGILVSMPKDFAAESEMESALAFFFECYHEDKQDFTRLKRWLRKEFNLEELKKASATISKAKEKHSKFPDWVQSLGTR